MADELSLFVWWKWSQHRNFYQYSRLYLPRFIIRNCRIQKNELEEWKNKILDLRIKLSKRGSMAGANSEREQREAGGRSGRTGRRASWAALPGDGDAAYSERNPPARPTSDCPPLAPDTRSTRSVPSPDPVHILSLQDIFKIHRVDISVTVYRLYTVQHSTVREHVWTSKKEDPKNE